MNENIINFARKLSIICGETICIDHIYEGTGRYYYIQPTEKGFPMLLRHYRGSLFIELHKDDLKGLQSGELDEDEFIRSANWLVGYFWGGGSMIRGGYYQPLDIVNRTEELQRYLRILACRTNGVSSGYIPDTLRCERCTVENCPFCPYDCKEGRWEDEAIHENDPRIAVYRALTKRFENLYPGYTLSGWLSAFTDGSTENALVRANTHWNENDPYSFTVWLPSEIVRGLLSHTIQVEDVDQFVNNFKFHHTEWNEEGYPEVTIDHIREIFSKDGMDYPVEQKRRDAEEKARQEEEERIAAERAKRRIFGFIYDMLHK